MIYIITRHAGALAWLNRRAALLPSVHFSHLHSVVMIHAGDLVMGTLPINLIAAINARGAHYFHLHIELPVHLRGCELNEAQLDMLGAELVEYCAKAVISDEVCMQLAQALEL
jgi:CRISPR-associated protein Csx16